MSHLFDDGENPRFVFIIAICADTKVDLVRERILFVRRGQLENAAPHRYINVERSPKKGYLSIPIWRRKGNPLPKFYKGCEPRILEGPVQHPPALTVFISSEFRKEIWDTICWSLLAIQDK